MNSDIQQLALTSTVPSIEKMIPIFIGTSKTIVSEEPIFTDTTYEAIQLSVDNDHAIDPNSIVPYITYWKQVSAEFSMNFITPTYIVYMPDLNIGVFDKDSIFALYDNSGELLFSSKIESFVYDVDVLTSIKLTTLCPLVGNYNFTLINKVKELVTFDFDNTTNQVWPNYSTFPPIVSFQNVISSESTISYKKYSKTVSLKTYETITPEDISNEQNTAISKGLLASSAAVVINIPNDTYINSVIELIKTLDYGYYIVPIDLSINSIKTLTSYVQFSELDTSYKTILIPAEQAENKIISSGTYEFIPNTVTLNAFVSGTYLTKTPLTGSQVLNVGDNFHYKYESSSGYFLSVTINGVSQPIVSGATKVCEGNITVTQNLTINAQSLGV